MVLSRLISWRCAPAGRAYVGGSQGNGQSKSSQFSTRRPTTKTLLNRQRDEKEMEL